MNGFRLRKFLRRVAKFLKAEKPWILGNPWRLLISRHASRVREEGAEVSYKVWFPQEKPIGFGYPKSQSGGVRWGLAFQGPFADIASMDYFLDLVSVIRTQEPAIPIVYTTSDLELAPVALPKLVERGVEYINFSDPGEITGHSTSKNLLRQVHSCWQGLGYLKSVGVSMAVRARTDQTFDLERLTASVSALSRLIDGQQEEATRIFGSSLNSFKRRPFGISDMLLVGGIDHLIRFFKLCDVESYFDQRMAVLECFPFLEPSEVDAPEVFLGARFMSSLTIEMNEDPLKLFWERHFGILPATFISHSWRRQQAWQHGSSHLWDKPKSLRTLVGGEMTFEEWLMIVSCRD